MLAELLCHGASSSSVCRVSHACPALALSRQPSYRPRESTHFTTLSPCLPRRPTLLQVPPFSDLPTTTGALLVKAVAPANLDAAGEQLFTGLVPDTWCVECGRRGWGLVRGLAHMDADTAWVGRAAAQRLAVGSTQGFAALHADLLHKALPSFCFPFPFLSARSLSKYSDLVDDLIRKQLDRLAGATDTARIKLREWELPDTLQVGPSTCSAAPPLASEPSGSGNSGSCLACGTSRDQHTLGPYATYTCGTPAHLFRPHAQALDARTSAALPEAVNRELGEVEGIGGVNHLKGVSSEEVAEGSTAVAPRHRPHSALSPAGLQGDIV